jgi:hypothetical protein
MRCLSECTTCAKEKRRATDDAIHAPATEPINYAISDERYTRCDRHRQQQQQQQQRVQRRGRLDDCLETGVSAAIVIVGR